MANTIRTFSISNFPIGKTAFKKKQLLYITVAFAIIRQLPQLFPFFFCQAFFR
jgi:hypothetical protein